MNTKQLPLTPQERSVVEEAFQPFLQAVTIIARLRGLNPAMAQLSADRCYFVVADDSGEVFHPAGNGITTRD